MSGDASMPNPLPDQTPVLLVAAARDSVTARLVGTLARLEAEGFEGFRVVGGLAVLCRVGNLFRATSDLDTIIEDDGPAIIALRTHPSASPTTNGVSIDGTLIDIIPIGPIDHADQLPDDPSSRLFVLAHRYAWDRAEPVSIDVVDPTDVSSLIVHAEVAMATTAPWAPRSPRRPTTWVNSAPMAPGRYSSTMPRWPPPACADTPTPSSTPATCAPWPSASSTASSLPDFARLSTASTSTRSTSRRCPQPSGSIRAMVARV
jgi:hypothetical protein